jgi:predicted DNA-binding transcriptional regulator AlpA
MRTDNAAAAAEPELITLAAFFRRFSVSKSSFYRMAARGEAPDVVKLGTATYVSLASARAWLASRIVPAATLGNRHGA